MNMTNCGVHEVIDIRVEPVKGKAESHIRWQTIRLTAKDGSIHDVHAYLHPTCAGIEPTPKRRMDDIPRQAVLNP